MPVPTSRIFPPVAICRPVSLLLRKISVLVHVDSGDLTNQYRQHGAAVWSLLFGTLGDRSLGQREWTAG